MSVTARARQSSVHEVLVQFAFPASKSLPPIIRLLSGMEIARALFGKVAEEKSPPQAPRMKPSPSHLSIYEMLNWLKSAGFSVADGNCDSEAKVAQILFSTADRLISAHYRQYGPDLYAYLLQMSLQNAWKVAALSDGETPDGRLTMIALEKQAFLRNLRVLRSLKFEGGKLVIFPPL